jgi:outer membrane protein OmpA-like peptidoglycan-associated protein
MKLTRLIPAFVSLFSLPVMAQQAQPLDVDAARAALSAKPPRNPVKSTSPIIKRSYERRAGKGLAVETGAPATVEVEIIHREDGSTEEHPFVSLPILFVINSDTLLDATSRTNADQMASILSDLIQKENARFTLQGHTSAEGDAGANQTLSEQRAARLHSLLAAKGVPSSALTSLGLGETCAQFPESAPDSQRQLDRRVLIVRMK